MNCSEANQYSIVEYLLERNYNPAKVRGNDYWYLSPYREEKTPSFKVNSYINRFYDHGIGVGGKLLDLALRLYPDKTISIILEDLKNRRNIPFFLQKPNVLTNQSSGIKILKTKPLNNIALIRYLENRGICEELGHKYCVEVHYEIQTLNGTKRFFAIGFGNDSSGFELRNKFFKGGSSPKDVTSFKNGSTSIIIFEGWIDFLSWLMLSRPKSNNADFLILNSINNISKGIGIIKRYPKIFGFLDNDEGGKRCLKNIENENIEVVDCSHLYGECNDLNDFLMGGNKFKISDR